MNLRNELRGAKNMVRQAWRDTGLSFWDDVAPAIGAILVILIAVAAIGFGGYFIIRESDRATERRNRETLQNVYRYCGSEEGHRQERYAKATGEYTKAEAQWRECLLNGGEK